MLFSFFLSKFVGTCSRKKVLLNVSFVQEKWVGKGMDGAKSDENKHDLDSGQLEMEL
jgi:hypothetical protein